MYSSYFLSILCLCSYRQETPSKESKIDSRDGKETGKDSGRKVWKDKEDRWQHDKFQPMDQAPKSREELLMVYGYDIRNEEAPPKARRRRRYGYVVINECVHFPLGCSTNINIRIIVSAAVAPINTLAVGKMKMLTVGH